MKSTTDGRRHLPTRPYDLIREGLIVLAGVSLVVVVLGLVFSSPDYPTVRAEDVAQRQPLSFLRTSANILAGNSSIDGYGPPYNSDVGGASQSILGVAPAHAFGVTEPVNPPEDFILKPLERVAVLNGRVGDAVNSFRSASTQARKTWLDNYLRALDSATAVNGVVQVPAGDYGPVATLMNGMLDLGRSGLLEGALESDVRTPFSLDFTRSLLFFQDGVYSSVANQLDMTGEQWGIVHETGAYPGAWWLLPYTFLYQIKPFSSSANADLQIGLLMTGGFIFLLAIPFVPIVNRLPRWIGVHRIIWRDWYGRAEGGASMAPREARRNISNNHPRGLVARKRS